MGGRGRCADLGFRRSPEHSIDARVDMNIMMRKRYNTFFFLHEKDTAT